MRALRLVCSLLSVTFAAGALAQKVVVLDLTGDRRDAIRRQVEQALTDAGQVEVIPLATWNGAATERGVAPRALGSVETIRTLAPELGVDAVVAGEVGKRFDIRIYDARGQEVWTKELPLRSGRLSEDNARRLASAIAVAATPTAEPTPVEPGPPDAGTPAVLEPAADAGVSTAAPPVEATPAAPATAVTPTVAKPAPGPKLFVLQVTGTTTWRSYCSRPSVSSCREYDDQQDGTEPPGETQTFNSSAPYIGYLAAAELFPLAAFKAWWSGFGVTGSFGQGFAQTRVRIANPNGSTPEQIVNAVDTTWSVEAAYRWYFPFGAEGLGGHLGGHAGYRVHTFLVDPGTTTLLASSLRRFPAVGIDARLPLAKLAQAELSASYLILPTPSPATIDRYGIEASSYGFRASAALTGEVWGPLGYVLRFSYERYGDQFTGTGTHWFTGGVAEESFSSAFFGVSAGF